MAEMTLRWLGETRGDLRDIWQYVSDQSDSADRATMVAVKIRTTASYILPGHPFAGPVIDEDVTGRHRHLICYNYRIIYRVEDEVVIVAVVHGARLLPPAVLRRK